MFRSKFKCSRSIYNWTSYNNIGIHIHTHLNQYTLNTTLGSIDDVWLQDIEDIGHNRYIYLWHFGGLVVRTRNSSTCIQIRIGNVEL